MELFGHLCIHNITYITYLNIQKIKSKFLILLSISQSPNLKEKESAGSEVSKETVINYTKAPFTFYFSN